MSKCWHENEFVQVATKPLKENIKKIKFTKFNLGFFECQQR